MYVEKYLQIPSLVKLLLKKRSTQPISWLSTEKLNLTQQKQTCIRNEI